MSNNSIWPILGATTVGQSGPGCNSHEEVFRIPQDSSITEVSPSDCFVWYPEYSLVESYASANLQPQWEMAM